MNVATLQQFLRSLIPALQTTDGGLRLAQDLERACHGLDPFRELDIDAFAGFLSRCEDYLRNGAVSPPSDIDLGPLMEPLRRLGKLRDRMESADGSAKTELAQAQRELNEGLARVASSAGLKGTLKVEPKWADEQAARARARAHARGFRELAARITEPAAFDRDEVRTELHRLEKEITSTEWKALAAEFGLPASTKGAKGVAEVLFKLTGHRAAKAKPSRKKAAVVLDEARIAQHAEPLQRLLEQAKVEAQLSEADIDQQMSSLEGLSKDELIAVAQKAGIEKPGSSAPAVKKKIKGLLMEGRRVMEQTAH